MSELPNPPNALSEPGGDFRRDQEFVSRLIHAEGRAKEFELCARLGIPSVAVIAQDLSDAVPARRKDRAFKIWVGAEVAKVMRSLGYEIVQRRGRVPWGRYFTYAAVWGRSTPLSPGKAEADGNVAIIRHESGDRPH